MFLPFVSIVSFFCVVQPVFFRWQFFFCLLAAIHRVLEIISILTHELCSALWNGWGMCEGMEGREAATAAEHRVKAGKTFQKCFECVLE